MELDAARYGAGKKMREENDLAEARAQIHDDVFRCHRHFDERMNDRRRAARVVSDEVIAGRRRVWNEMCNAEVLMYRRITRIRFDRGNPLEQCGTTLRIHTHQSAMTRRRTRRHLALAAAACVALATPKEALAYDESSAAVVANTGFHVGIGPVILIPPGNRPIGGGLDLDLRYGIGLDPVIVAPGGRLAGYFISGRFIGMAMPTARLTLPVGPLAPFLSGGVGGGWISNPSEAGVALLGGGGLMVHFGRVFALGVEATYQTITGTDFHSLAIGPSILIGL